MRRSISIFTCVVFSFTSLGLQSLFAQPKPVEKPGNAERTAAAKALYEASFRTPLMAIDVNLKKYAIGSVEHNDLLAKRAVLERKLREELFEKGLRDAFTDLALLDRTISAERIRRIFGDPATTLKLKTEVSVAVGLSVETALEVEKVGVVVRELEREGVVSNAEITTLTGGRTLGAVVGEYARLFGTRATGSVKAAFAAVKGYPSAMRHYAFLVVATAITVCVMARDVNAWPVDGASGQSRAHATEIFSADPKENEKIQMSAEGNQLEIGKDSLGEFKAQDPAGKQKTFSEIAADNFIVRRWELDNARVPGDHRDIPEDFIAQMREIIDRCNLYKGRA